MVANNMPIAPAYKKQRGSSLIEVLIALLVFTIGLQGVTALQFQAVKENFDSSQRSKGVWAAQELINRIRANPVARANGDYAFPTGNPCAAGAPATYCGERSTIAADDCNATEMAAFDIWESMCLNPNTTANTNLTPTQSTLTNLSLTITCAPCQENSELLLLMTWQSKSVTDDSDITDTDDSLKTQTFQQAFVP